MTIKVTDVKNLDMAGQGNPDRYVNKTYFHPKTKRLYKVTGFTFDSERELWLLTYFRVTTDGAVLSPFPFSHTIDDFHREGRFLEIAHDPI